MHRAANRVALVAIGALVACTGVNPEFVGRDLGGSAGGDARAGDLAVPVGRDLAVQVCVPGQRQCAGNVTQQCVGTGFIADRTCPMDSICEAGSCLPPPRREGTTQGNGCVSESQCYVSAQTFNYSCQPFVVDPRTGRIELRCAYLFGQGGSGNACTTGADCRSGFCLADRKTCFRACFNDPDCPNRNNVKTLCREVTFVVDGVTTRARSCVLP